MHVPAEWDSATKVHLMRLLAENPCVTDSEAYLALLDPETEDFADRDNLPVGTPVIWTCHDDNQYISATIKEILSNNRLRYIIDCSHPSSPANSRTYGTQSIKVYPVCVKIPDIQKKRRAKEFDRLFGE